MRGVRYSMGTWSKEPAPFSETPPGVCPKTGWHTQAQAPPRYCNPLGDGIVGGREAGGLGFPQKRARNQLVSPIHAVIRRAGETGL
jgi:hypothetical protein